MWQTLRNLFAEMSTLQSKTIKLGDYRGSKRFTIGEGELEMMVHSVNFEENLGRRPFLSS